MDAVTLLINEHEELEALFKKLDQEDLSVVPSICSILSRHVAVEEKVFYPAVQKRTDVEDDEVDEALEEHHLMKILVSEIGELRAGDPEYKAKAQVLSELARHHHEEEEEDIFPEVRKELSADRLEALGASMVEFEEQTKTA